MVIEKQPVSEMWAPFSFCEPSARVQQIKSLLLSGHSVFIEPVYAEASTGFLIVVYRHDVWTLEEILEASFFDGGLGMHELHSLSVLSLGTKNEATQIIDETLDAGFIVCLLSDLIDEGHVLGAYMLRASIADSS